MPENLEAELEQEFKKVVNGGMKLLLGLTRIAVRDLEIMASGLQEKVDAMDDEAKDTDDVLKQE